MGLTAGIVGGAALLGKANSYNNATRKKGMVAAASAGQTAKDILDPANVPTPPDVTTSNANAGKAMTAAANRVRRQKAGGYGATFSNGGAGDSSAVPTIRKRLLGE